VALAQPDHRDSMVITEEAHVHHQTLRSRSPKISPAAIHRRGSIFTIGLFGAYSRRVGGTI
jgi:hypothetical protein